MFVFRDEEHFFPGAADAPNATNLDPSQLPVWPPGDGRLIQKLRWVTLGHQYQWSTRVYQRGADLPALCKELASRASEAAGVPMTPDAAIVNFYHGCRPSDRLGGHVDEEDGPLVSFSLGLPAVFLLGGASRTETPTALILRCAALARGRSCVRSGGAGGSWRRGVGAS